MTQEAVKPVTQLYPIQIQLQHLQHEVAERKREAMLWHQRAIQYEEALEAKDNELKAVLKAKGNIPEMVLEALLTYHTLCGGIESAIKALGGFKWFKLDKWMALTILGLFLIGFFWANPTAGTQLQLFMQTPTNQGIIVIIAIAIVAILLLGKRTLHK